MVLVVGWGLTACGDDGYEYVANNDAGLYFRVPDSWAILEVDPVDTGRPEAIGDPRDVWARLIDRSPTPGPANFETPVPSYPVGLALVQDVPDLDSRDDLNYSSLRAMAYDGVDPYTEARVEGSPVQVVSLDEVLASEGARGQRIVFTVHRDDGTYVTYDQIALVDDLTTEIYRLLLKCESTCYERNRDEIDAIVESWTVDRED
jgi:hypothetical protein